MINMTPTQSGAASPVELKACPLERAREIAREAWERLRPPGAKSWSDLPDDMLTLAIVSARDALLQSRTTPGGGEAQDHSRSIMFGYTNYRGESAVRTTIPHRIYWGSTEWHPEPQWLLEAWDSEREAIRQFALTECVFDRAAIVGASPSKEEAQRIRAEALEEALHPLGAAMRVRGKYENDWHEQAVYVFSVEWTQDGPSYTVCDQWPPKREGFHTQSLTDGFAHHELEPARSLIQKGEGK